jgi:succinate-semialdehyde dehydrogenase/glutarate-semialdehyde dehydrogenase
VNSSEDLNNVTLRYPKHCKLLSRTNIVPGHIMQNLKEPSLWRQQAFVDGIWCNADSGQSIAVTNPATGKQIGTIPLMGTIETRRAIDAANKAWGPWRQRTAKDRGGILRKWSDLMLTHADDLALIMTCEQGKPLTESKAEIAYAASFIDWFAEEGKRTYGDTVPSPMSTNRIVVIKEPIGVCAAITPWNFPSAMITRKVGPALAAGCTMVLKPSEATPFSALALAVLAEQAGLPAGVFGIVTGTAREIGGELTSNTIVRKLTFTGSTEVGRLLMQQCAPTIKKLSLELGGNAPFIVFDDADLDAAVEGALVSKYRNSGQTCVCANRLYVQDGVYEKFARKLVARIQAIKVGDGRDGGVTQGPLIDENAVKKVEEHIADAIAKGGRVLVGGKRHPLGLTFSSRRSLPKSPPTCASLPRKHSDRWRRCSVFRRRQKY